MKVARLSRQIRSGLWFVPLLYALAGILLNVTTTALDRLTDHDLIPMEWLGGPDAALTILGTVAASMIGLVATVLAITMVVIQLAMAQFSPRIVQTFLQDRPSQHAIGLFVATFVQGMLSMREVMVDEADPVVPGISIAVVFVMVVVDIVVLVVYIHHIGNALRVSALIELVGGKARALIDELYPDRIEGAVVDDPHEITAEASGALNLIGHDDLIEIASKVDACIEVVPALGEYVSADSPLVRLHGATVDQVDVEGIRRSLVLGLERELDQDLAFGLRMLVDMGVKAISESPFQDPTTTVQVVDRIHDLLRHLAVREFPGGEHRDRAGVVRLIVRSMDWEAYVRLGFDELRLAGSMSPQVARRLRASLLTLAEVAPEARREPLRTQLRMLDERVQRSVDEESDRALGLGADGLGIGVAAGRP